MVRSRAPSGPRRAYGAPDQRNHAPNENMRLDLIHKGTLTSAALFVLLATGGRWSERQ